MFSFPPDFSPLVRQLIEPPLTSTELLDASMTAPLAAQPAWALFPIIEARAAISTILTDPMTAPPSAMFLPFRAEASRYDVVRVRYEAAGLRLDVAQSKHVFSVRTTLGAENVEDLATRLFRAPMSIHLKKPRNIDGFEFGARETAYGLMSSEWPHWFDALFWWRLASAAGFVTIKATGGPTREVISFDDELNVHWFS
jgi:hypothetical protein